MGTPSSSSSLWVLQCCVWKLACPLRELLCPSAWQPCSGQVSVLLLDVVPGGFMLWSVGSSVALEQVILMGLRLSRVACLPSSPEPHVLVHGKAVGTVAGICSCSTARSWGLCPNNRTAPLENGEEEGVYPRAGEAAALQANISFAGRHSWALRSGSDNVLSHKGSHETLWSRGEVTCWKIHHSPPARM